MKNRRITLMLAVVLMLALSSNVLAAEYDFHNLKDPSKSYGKLEFATSTAKRLDVAKAPGDYAIEAKDGKLYEYKKVIAKMSEGKTFEEAIAEIEPVEKPTEGLEVVEVSAITTTAVTVDNGTSAADAIAKLDSKVTLTLSDSSTKDAAITWTADANYDGTKAGDYTFTGKITLPDGVTDPDGKVADVTAKVTVAPAQLAVTSVSAITTTAVTVDNGTSAADAIAKLDSKVTLTLSDSSTKDAAITWTADANYDGTKAGDYTFTGKITLPDGVTDPDGKVADVTAKVTVAPAQLAVTSVSAITTTAVTVDNGTSAADAIAKLDSKVTLTLSDSSTKDAAITWTADANYDGTKAGDYTFTGKITLPDGVTDPDGKVADVTAKVTVAPAQLAVTSVSAINATTVSATMAADVDATKAADKAEYTVKVGDETIAVTNVSYNDTTKVSLLTVALAGKEGALTVNGKAAAKEIDYKAPTIASVTAVSSTELKVVFSEKVGKKNAEDVRNYSINYLATTTALVANTDTAALAADGKTLTITIATPAAKLTDGEHTFVVTQAAGGANRVADLAGNLVGTNASLKFMGVSTADVTPPTVVSSRYDAAGGVLNIKFDEIMDNALASLDRTKISVTDGTTSVALTSLDIASWNAAKDQLTIQLSAAKKTEVNALGATKTLSLAAGAVKDAAGNANAQVAGIAIEANTVLTAATYDAALNKLTLTFNNDVKIDGFNVTELSMLNPGTFSLLASPNSVVTTTADGKTVEITIKRSAALDTYEADTIGTRQVKFTKGTSKDKAGELIETSTVDLAFAKDTTAPVMTAAKYNATTGRLSLVFNENVRVQTSASTLDFTPSNVKVTKATDNSTDVSLAGNAGATDPKVEQADGSSGVASASTVTIFNGTTAGQILASSKVPADGAKIYFAKGTFKDDAGNDIAEVTKANAIPIEYVDNTPVKLTATATHVSTKVVDVAFDKEVTKASAENVTNYKIAKNDNPSVTLTPTSAIMAADKKTVTITVSETPVVGYTYVVRASNIVDKYGNTIVDNGTTNVASWIVTAATDTTPPKLAATGVTYKDTNNNYIIDAGDYIEFKFTEPVVIQSGITSADFDGSGLKTNSAAFAATTNGFGAGATYVVGDTADVVRVILGTNPVITAADFSAGSDSAFNSKASTKIKDLAGNNAAVGTASQFNKPDTTSPQLLTAVYADANGNGKVDQGDTLTLTFNESLDTNASLATLAVGDFTLKDGSDTFGTGFAAAYSTTSTIVITLGTSPDLDGATTTENYLTSNSEIDVKTSQTVIKDLWGNAADASANKKITSEDKTRPTITGVSIKAAGANLANNDKINITFSEAVTLKATPVLADFVLYQGVTPVVVAGDDAVAVSGNVVTITVGTTAGSSNLDGKAVNTFTSFNLAGASSVFDASGNAAKAALGFGVEVTVSK
ncbi:MAG: beta strand repeat-containing protein [Bacillota bacterium]